MLVTVAFVSQKGGVGKSTLARALAAVAVSAKIRVKVADLDPQQQTVARWEERREDNRSGPALSVVSVGTAAEALQCSDPRDELLIIDAPARAGRGTLEVARHADLIVQPTGAGIDDLDPAIMLFQELVREGVARGRLVMAFCRVATQAEEDAARAYVLKAGYAVLPGSIRERSAYREAHNRGRAVSEMNAKGLNGRADTLLARLLAMITDQVKARVEAAKSQKRKGKAR